MTDPQSPIPQPLQYWHTIGPRGRHPALLAMSAMGGFLFGMLFAGGLGFFLTMGAVGFEDFDRHRTMTIVVAGTLCTIAVALAVCAAQEVKFGPGMPVEFRFSALRFFEQGFLCGGGFTCAIEAICLVAAAVIS